MLDPVVVSAFIVLAAWLIKLGAAAVGIALDEATVNSIAAAFIAYLLGKFGLAVTRTVLPGLVNRGFLSSDE